MESGKSSGDALLGCEDTASIALGAGLINLKTAIKATAETRRASCENSQP
jgi:hypothetical protein